jgi:hypothetical protein
MSLEQRFGMLGLFISAETMERSCPPSPLIWTAMSRKKLTWIEADVNRRE